jgi:ribosomal protein S18
MVLTVIFLIFTIKAFYEDNKAMQQISDRNHVCPICDNLNHTTDLNNPEHLHKFIVEVIKHENHSGHFTDSKVKKVLSATRDQVIRGVILGGLEGSVVSAVNGAIAWALTGGIVSGIGDMLGWKTRFF